MDATAFSNWNLDEKFYMNQLEGYKEKEKEI